MKKVLFMMLVFFTGITGSYAAKVTMVTVDRNLYDFVEIVNTCPYDIHFYESKNYMVKVVGRSSDVNYVYTVLRDGILTVITSKNHKFKEHPYVEIYCPKHKLAKYVGLGDGNFIAKTAMNLLDVVFSVSGKGGITLGIVNARDIYFQSHGSGNINVSKASVSGKKSFTQKGAGNIVFNGQKQSSTAPAKNAGNDSKQSSTTTRQASGNNTTTNRTTSGNTNTNSNNSSNNNKTSTNRTTSGNNNTNSNNSSNNNKTSTSRTTSGNTNTNSNNSSNNNKTSTSRTTNTSKTSSGSGSSNSSSRSSNQSTSSSRSSSTSRTSTKR